MTASYLLDDCLERNDLQTAYNEAQRRSWLLLLALALALLYLVFRNVFVVAGAQTLFSLVVLLGNSAEDALLGRDVADLDDEVAKVIRNA